MNQREISAKHKYSTFSSVEELENHKFFHTTTVRKSDGNGPSWSQKKPSPKKVVHRLHLANKMD